MFIEYKLVHPDCRQHSLWLSLLFIFVKNKAILSSVIMS